MNDINIKELVEEFNSILESKGFDAWKIKKLKVVKVEEIGANPHTNCRWVEIPRDSGNWEERCD